VFSNEKYMYVYLFLHIKGCVFQKMIRMWSLFIDLKHFPQPLSQGAVPGHSSHFEGTFESRCACDLVRFHYNLQIYSHSKCTVGLWFSGAGCIVSLRQTKVPVG